MTASTKFHKSPPLLALKAFLLALAISGVRGNLPYEDYEDGVTTPEVSAQTLSLQEASSSDCLGRAEGYYADVDTNCETFHYCKADGSKATFTCPPGSRFNQKHLVCDRSLACYPITVVNSAPPRELLPETTTAASPKKAYPEISPKKGDAVQRVRIKLKRGKKPRYHKFNNKYIDDLSKLPPKFSRGFFETAQANEFNSAGRAQSLGSDDAFIPLKSPSFKETEVFLKTDSSKRQPKHMRFSDGTTTNRTRNARKYIPRRDVPRDDDDYYRERVIPFRIYRSKDDSYKDEAISFEESSKEGGINRERFIMPSPSRHSYIYAHGRAKPYRDFEADTFLHPKVALLEIKPESARRYQKPPKHLRQKRQVPYGGMYGQPEPAGFQGAPTTNNDFVKFPFTLPEPFRSFFRAPVAEGSHQQTDPFNVDFTRPFISQENGVTQEEEEEVGEDATETVQSRTRPGYRGNRERVQPPQTPSTGSGATPGDRITGNPFYPPLPTIRPNRNQIPQYHRPPFQQTEFNNFDELYPYLQKNFPFPFTPRGFGETTTPNPQTGTLAKEADGANKPGAGIQDEDMVTLNIMHGPTQSPMENPPSFDAPQQRTPQSDTQGRPRRPGRRRRPTKEPSNDDNVLPKNSELEPLIPLRDIPLPQYSPDPFAHRFFAHDNFPGFRPPPFQEDSKENDDDAETQTEPRRPFRNPATAVTNPIQATDDPGRRATRPTRPTRPTQRPRSRVTAPPAPPSPPRSREERVEAINESHENDALNGLPFGARIRSNGQKVDRPTLKPKRQEPPVRQPAARALPDPLPRQAERLIQSEPPQPFAQNIRQTSRGRNQARRPIESGHMINQPHPGVTMPAISQPQTSPQRRPPFQKPDGVILLGHSGQMAQRDESARATPIRGSTQRLVTSRQSSRFRPSPDEIEILPQSPSTNEERTRRHHRRPTMRDRATSQTAQLQEDKEKPIKESESFRSTTGRNSRFRNSNLNSPSERDRPAPNSADKASTRNASQTPRQSRRGRTRGRQQNLEKQGEGSKEDSNKENAQMSPPPRTQSNRKRFRKPRPQMIPTTEAFSELEPTTPLFMSHVEYLEEDPDFPQKSIQILQDNPINLSALPFHETTTTAPETFPTTNAPGRVFTARAGGSLFHRRPRPGRPRQPPQTESGSES